MIYALLVLAGVAAYVIQELRVRKAQSEAKEFEELCIKWEETYSSWRKITREDMRRYEDTIKMYEGKLKELEEVCRESDDPDAVRARLRLLLNPTATRPATVGQQSLPLDRPPARSEGAGSGGGS